MKQSLTYKKAGVDVKGAHSFVQGLEPLARMTRRAGLLRGIGGFGGLFDLKPSAAGRSVMVASADGVGTKILLARRVGWYEPLGTDLVAMNVNDILCVGAEPLFFLDYIASGKLDPRVMMQVMRGIVRGCVESHCVLLGGETAQMALMYKPGEFDLGGFTVGIVGRNKIISGQSIRPGDVVLGLPSSGIHSNGYTLVQKALPVARQKQWGRELLAPTRIYVRPVLDLLRKKTPLHGIAHITGGSFQEKLKRILPEGTTAHLRRNAWPVLPVFKKIQAEGVSADEMYRTFNMGIGMTLALPPKAVAGVQRLLKKQSTPSWVIGEIVRGKRGVEWVK